VDLTPRPFPARASAVAARGMVATSQPLATQAGLRALERGGNAIDAALAAAAVLCVVEPMSTGVGGDCFSLVWRDGELTGLNASGRAPAAADPDALGTAVPVTGPLAVTAPGAVAGWAALAERHGRLGLDRALADAIDIAERGFAVTPVIAGYWAAAAAALAGFDEAARVFLPAPRVGQITWAPELAATLRRIASEGPAGLYQGPVGEAICAVTPLTLDDLAVSHAEWVEPLRQRYRGVEVCEIPPNGQGVAALQALGILDGLEHTAGSALDRVHLQSEAMKLAFADAERHVHDGPLPERYLDEEYLASRRALIDAAHAGSPVSGALQPGGTVYLCAVDEDRNACSLIQSVYHAFGSLVVAPGTGVALQNRGHCFTLEPGHPNRLAPGKRPYHTIIPGLLLRDGALAGPFGLMGGHMQPQGHLQFVSHMIDRGLDPQAALDEPRWRLDSGGEGEWTLALEEPLYGLAPELARRGHQVLCDPNAESFGGGQAIMLRDDVLIGGTESRKDGVVLGY
jgi:gamma-glutamyltranspeptidase/glutathione hydrolase